MTRHHGLAWQQKSQGLAVGVCHAPERQLQLLRLQQNTQLCRSNNAIAPNRWSFDDHYVACSQRSIGCTGNKVIHSDTRTVRCEVNHAHDVEFLPDHVRVIVSTTLTYEVWSLQTGTRLLSTKLDFKSTLVSSWPYSTYAVVSVEGRLRLFEANIMGSSRLAMDISTDCVQSSSPCLLSHGLVSNYMGVCNRIGNAMYLAKSAAFLMYLRQTFV